MKYLRIKTIHRQFSKHWRILAIGLISVIVLALLMGIRLGSLAGGISASEQHIAVTPIGWHDIGQNPLYLPLSFVRSAVFSIWTIHSGLIVRLPNTLFGVIAIIAVGLLLRQWHGTRSAIFGTILFATASWTLHVSRYASNDSLYLCALPLLLLFEVLLQKYRTSTAVLYSSALLWGVALYIPGLVGFVVACALFRRTDILKGWQSIRSRWQQALLLVAFVGWLPGLVANFFSKGSNFRLWLGLPAKFGNPVSFLKHFLDVVVYLLIHGPSHPQIWLERTPILDIFSLTMCVLGIYFYARHFRAQRARVLAVFFLLGAVLVACNGPVLLSLLIPLLFIFITAGMAYIVHEWFAIFPINPLARNFGVALVSLAVVASCFYNLRAYFIVWPHDTSTQAVFDRKD